MNGFERPPFDVFGDGLTPVNNGAEDLSRIREGLEGAGLGLHRKAGLLAGAFGRPHSYFVMFSQTGDSLVGQYQ